MHVLVNIFVETIQKELFFKTELFCNLVNILTVVFV